MINLIFESSHYKNRKLLSDQQTPVGRLDKNIKNVYTFKKVVFVCLFCHEIS